MSLVLLFHNRSFMVSGMYLAALAGAIAALLVIALMIRRAAGALLALTHAAEHVASTLEQGSGEVTDGELAQRLEVQNTKIDGLQILWNDFLDKANRAAARLEGARGGKPSHRNRNRVEEPDDDEPGDHDEGAGSGQRVLALPQGVGGVRAARSDPFAALPPMRLKG